MNSTTVAIKIEIKLISAHRAWEHFCGVAFYGILLLVAILLTINIILHKTGCTLHCIYQFRQQEAG